MYGVMRAAACSLPVSERQAWVGHLCGLCMGLCARFGQAARLATNYDSALVIALSEAQSDQVLAKGNHRCLLRRPVTTLVDDPGCPAVQYAAGTAMLAVANKIRDNLNDDPTWLSGLRGGAGALARRWGRAAGACLGTLGFDAGLVERQFTCQPVLEAVAGGDFTFYSQPTELALGAVFAHTAVLQGKPHNYNPLFEIGRKFGRIMLLLDAYQDYDLDTQAGRFNALAASYPVGDWRQPAQEIFRRAFAGL